MSIRINKRLGWIITGQDLDLEPLSKITMNDLRQENPNCEELKMDLSFTKLKLTDTLDNFVEEVTDDGEEDESKKVFVFTPPLPGERWQRYDDAIDYYEANGIMELQIKYLNQEIFPYSQPFVVSKTLIPLNQVQLQNARIFSEFGDKFTNKLKEELSSLGFDLTQNLKSQFHMTAPKIIELVAKKVGVNDHRVLRPGIATFWR